MSLLTPLDIQYSAATQIWGCYTIAAEQVRQANVRNDASGSGPVRVEGAVELRRWFKKTESVFEISECAEGKKTKMKQLMTTEFCSIEEIQSMEHELWNLKIKEYGIVAYTQRFNELALMCPRMVEPERVKVDAYIRGLTNNIKGEVTSSKPADLNEAVRMAHKLMEQKSQARNERILEGKKRKWENLQGGNSSGKGNQKDNSRQTLQNNQKQGNARAMVTAPTDGKLPLCERCFTRHVGQCTIKCHKCGKVGHKARYCREKSVATGANAQPIWTCYDCGEQGHTRNRCPKKVKQEEVGEVRGRAYAIKDAEPKGPNVVTGTFLLNNRYASVLFDSGSDRSFVNTRFSSLLDIKPIKIEDSYEVELADGRVVNKARGAQIHWGHSLEESSITLPLHHLSHPLLHLSHPLLHLSHPHTIFCKSFDGPLLETIFSKELDEVESDSSELSELDEYESSSSELENLS
ncbi:putative reverse transcriptase domain-containing protein [Tanacetum coccineum]